MRRVLVLALVLFGCHPRSPFDAKDATVQIARLQSFEAKPGESAPPEIETWLGKGASGLPADLVPPGLVVGGTPLPPFASDARRFHGFHELESRPLTDAVAKDALAWAEHVGGAEESAQCMYPEFGLRVTHAHGDSADVLVSLACKKMRVLPDRGASSEESLSEGARARFAAIVRRAFGGGP